ncbi:MAG: ECF-type sigma factor [Pseudomonadota bacterium]
MVGETEFQSLLKEWRSGDEAARNRVVALVHTEIETLASIILRKTPWERSFVTTDLVNETFIELMRTDELVLNDRAHLMALSARIMRYIVIDRARKRSAVKRSGQLVTLSTIDGADGGPDFEAIALDTALRRLHAIDPARAQIVEMRYFGGMRIEEIGEILGISASSVKRSWRVAQTWLKEAITHDLDKQ